MPFVFLSWSFLLLQLNFTLVSRYYCDSDFEIWEKSGFKLAHLTNFVYAGEVPRDKMYELLTTKWDVGDNLATALIDHYGGHIFDMFLKLEELNFSFVYAGSPCKPFGISEKFCAGSQWQADGVMECLQFNGDKAHMRELLTQIAENGFALLKDRDDREAEVIRKHNIGGLVQRKSDKVIGLSADVWGEHGIGLVSYKQSIRLVIANVLEENP